CGRWTGQRLVTSAPSQSSWTGKVPTIATPGRGCSRAPWRQGLPASSEKCPAGSRPTRSTRNGCRPTGTPGGPSVHPRPPAPPSSRRCTTQPSTSARRPGTRWLRATKDRAHILRV
ncbi:MAG: hypothetical protein AVDCRST_MAG77-5815, partial [uncultured Chloroflexi bacterium]